MPYTAPLKSTPSAQHIEYSDLPHSCPASPTTVDPKPTRPHLPRSYSSASYLRRHRRSSHDTKTLPLPKLNNPKWSHDATSHSSIRQSPPPITAHTMPPGAVISPPESSPNSSDEEPSYTPRGEIQLEELEKAVRSIEQRRVPSPERKPLVEDTPSSSLQSAQLDGQKPSHLPLSKEARKICHSRSATEHDVMRKHEEALTSSPEDSDRDDEPCIKQPMVRKKSGELVRPALRPPSARRRPSSMPGTPTYSKAVHFDPKLEHIRHFLQLDKPQAVSAETSPIEDYNADEFPFKTAGPHEPASQWQLCLANFPKDVSSRSLRRVRLERLFLSSDQQSLVGVVAVANLAFQKHVATRFTFDHWKTVSEVVAEFNDDVRRKQVQDGYDRFSFSIALNDQAHLEKKTMFLCIRYSVDGQEYWDNNDSMNYQVNFQRVPKGPVGSQGSPAARPRAPPLPRSRSFAGTGGRPVSMPAGSLDGMSGMDGYLSFGQPPKIKSTTAFADDVSRDVEVVAPIRREKPSHQVFGNRYDFEASLSAAIRTKPTHDRTTLTARAKSEGSSADHEAREPKKMPGLVTDKALPVSELSPETARPEPVKPSSFLYSKPHHQSSVYKELVDRYCFYGSPTGTFGGGNRPFSLPHDDPFTKPGSPSPHSSASSSPNQSPTENPSRTVSPDSFGYPYLENNNFIKESHTPTAIRG